MCVANAQFGAHNAKTPTVRAVGVLMVPNVRQEDAVRGSLLTPGIAHLELAVKRGVFP
jgi:hypothetical protein